MTANLLREAASVLRERAEAATPGPWTQNGFEYDDLQDSFTYDVGQEGERSTHSYCGTKDDAAYIATVHPAVGLALADSLDEMASSFERGFARPGWAIGASAERVAAAILGRSK